MAGPSRRRVIVSGRVQGVFFRDSVRRHALDRKLAGWVRNRDDGTVEAVFEGPEDDVEALIAFCRTGPEDAEVESVEFVAEDPRGETAFRVR